MLLRVVRCYLLLLLPTELPESSLGMLVRPMRLVLSTWDMVIYGAGGSSNLVRNNAIDLERSRAGKSVAWHEALARQLPECETLCYHTCWCSRVELVVARGVSKLAE